MGSIRIFTGDVIGHLQSKMTRGTSTKLFTQVQGGTALKQLPGNGRQSNSRCASDMGDCVECMGVRLACATVVSETVEGTGHCVEERLLVVVEHRYPRVRLVALHIGVEGRDLPRK